LAYGRPRSTGGEPAAAKEAELVYPPRLTENEDGGYGFEDFITTDSGSCSPPTDDGPTGPEEWVLEANPVTSEVSTSASSVSRSPLPGRDPRNNQLLEVAGDGQRLGRLQIAVWRERTSHLANAQRWGAAGSGLGVWT
jgi:hypothetical protein